MSLTERLFRHSRSCKQYLTPVVPTRHTDIFTRMQPPKDLVSLTCMSILNSIATFISLHHRATPLSDLTFTEEGNPDELQSSKELVNFAKRELICNIIREV